MENKMERELLEKFTEYKDFFDEKLNNLDFIFSGNSYSDCNHYINFEDNKTILKKRNNG